MNEKKFHSNKTFASLLVFICLEVFFFDDTRCYFISKYLMKTFDNDCTFCFKTKKGPPTIMAIKLFKMRVFRYIDRQMLTTVNAMCLLSKIIIFQLPLLKKIIVLSLCDSFSNSVENLLFIHDHEIIFVRIFSYRISVKS